MQLPHDQPWIDLSYPLAPEMPVFPSAAHVSFRSEIIATIPQTGRATRAFAMGSHCGTHIDAPSHFLPHGKTIEQIPLATCIGPAHLAYVGTLEPCAIITEDALAANWPTTRAARLVIRTDWSRYRATPQFYRDWPVLSSSCVAWLLERGVQFIGCDTPSPDAMHDGQPCTPDSPNHKVLLHHDVVIAENLTNLAQLPPGPIFLIANPLPLRDFDGAPARICATPWQKDAAP